VPTPTLFALGDVQAPEAFALSVLSAVFPASKKAPTFATRDLLTATKRPAAQGASQHGQRQTPTLACCCARAGVQMTKPSVTTNIRSASVLVNSLLNGICEFA
jgi:hypothetical protein